MEGTRFVLDRFEGIVHDGILRGDITLDFATGLVATGHFGADTSRRSASGTPFQLGSQSIQAAFKAFLPPTDRALTPNSTGVPWLIRLLARIRGRRRRRAHAEHTPLVADGRHTVVSDHPENQPDHGNAHQENSDGFHPTASKSRLAPPARRAGDRAETPISVSH